MGQGSRNHTENESIKYIYKEVLYLTPFVHKRMNICLKVYLSFFLTVCLFNYLSACFLLSSFYLSMYLIVFRSLYIYVYIVIYYIDAYIILINDLCIWDIYSGENSILKGIKIQF